MNEWRGFTHPSLLSTPIVRLIWRKLFCKRGWHLWDEVLSLEDHYLSCDACDSTVRLRGGNPYDS